ncbi:MAG TPA: alpha/beta hydrolase [Cytophagales bacterium]|nr:alpha/beta hydrolase [Cytophagales bacterium]
MHSGYYLFEHQNIVLGYLKAGSGPTPLLSFHGFGQNHQAFDSLVDELGTQFTLYSFDLFFHGKSEWPNGETPISKAEWKALLERFLKENQIDRFSLMGFSLGGKFALASLEAFASKIIAIYLMAPDGIKTNFWYSLATYPVAFRSLFKSMITKPGRFLSIVHFAGALRLIDKGVMRFAQSQMDSEEKRKRVYYSWVVFRRFKFDMHHIADIINSHQIELHIIIGRFDKIITAKNMNHLLRHVQGHQLKILETGHNGLIQRSGELFRNIASKNH